MYKFDTASVFGSYIKQLLHGFHLPTYRVYTIEQARYRQKIEQELNNLAIQISKTKVLIKTKSGPEKEALIELLAELEAHQKELNDNKEINVLSSYIRTDGEHYPNSQNWRQQPTTYPKVMTYIPYIKDGVIQEYIDGK